MPLPLVGRLTKGVSSVVGLGQEAYYHNKEKKEAAAQGSAPTEDRSQDQLDIDSKVPDYPPPTYDEIEDDEDDWLADEAQNQVHPPIAEDGDSKDSLQKAVKWFKERHPNPSGLPSIGRGRLPAPVVVPQRRPEMRSRGFVRAYAPALEDCGVDQAAFLDFLAGFDTAIQGQGWFNATNVAVALTVLSYTAAVAPSVIVHFTALAVHTSIEAGRRLYISKKENSYLDEMNAHYFQPRGLYAMVMAYKPGNQDVGERVDFNSMTASAVDKRTNENKSKMADFKAASGKTLDNQLPQVCELVYPDLEKASDEQKANAFKRSVAFARDYYDRRSQVQFAAQHPESGIQMQEHQFHGKYGDPTNFQNSGLLGVLSGGKIDGRRRRFERKNNRRIAQGRQPAQAGGKQRQGLIKRALGDNVLYVMVVNMPSEEELQTAKEAEERMKKDHPNWLEKLTSSVSQSSQS